VSTFALEQGVPIPEACRRTRNRCLFPFAKMEVGQSFFVPLEQAWTLSTSASQFQRKHPGHRRFTTRMVEGGVRCWRVE
jgi:hypothetical protein